MPPSGSLYPPRSFSVEDSAPTSSSSRNNNSRFDRRATMRMRGEGGRLRGMSGTLPSSYSLRTRSLIPPSPFSLFNPPLRPPSSHFP